MDPEQQSHVIMKRSNVIRMLQEYRRNMTNFLDNLPAREKQYPDRSTYQTVAETTVQLCDFSNSFPEYIKFWIRKISSCDCEDAYLTAVFINLYNAFKEYTLTGLRDEISVQLLSDKGLTDVREGIDYRMMNVGRVMESKDWFFLKALIRYGIIRPSESLTISEEMTHGRILKTFLYRMALRWPLLLECFRINFHITTILFRLNRSAYDSLDADGKAKILRKYTVLKSLAYQYYIWDTQRASDVLKCIKYYFQVIPDPFVTTREIEDLVEILETSGSGFDRHHLRSFIIKYRTLFPESDVLQPRSLQHLSRCAAREHLCKDGLLPQVVSRLMIPKAIKDYLLVVGPES